MFLIYRAKLFKLLYKNIVKFFNNHCLDLKYIAFQKIKQNQYNKSKNKKKINKDKILHRIFTNQNPNNIFQNNKCLIFNNKNNEIKRTNSSYNYFMNNINSQRTINKNGNSKINKSMTTNNNCIQIIKRKNQSESKKNGEESSELCRNIYELKEKYEEIQKRKSLEQQYNNNNNKINILYNDKKMNIKTKNNNNNYNNLTKYIYKKKKLDNFNDKYNTNDIRSFSNKYNKKFINKTGEHFISNINNSLEKTKKLNQKYEINKNNIMNRLYNANMKRKKEKKCCIRKKIKNIKSSDKRLFVNINYVYLSNINMKGKNIKYNEKLLEIKNPDNFSIKIKNNNNNYKYDIVNTNGSILTGIKEENESSIINYTDSVNSVDYYKKTNKNKYKNISTNDKYLFSCINFITKNIKRILLKNNYNFFKKQLYI